MLTNLHPLCAIYSTSHSAFAWFPRSGNLHMWCQYTRKAAKSTYPATDQYHCCVFCPKSLSGVYSIASTNTSHLDVNKALGPDGIPARVLKECANELAPSLCYLFNKSLSLCVVPSQWELAHVVPIHKKGSKEHVSSYRPVSLLCILSKVLERCVFDRLYKHLAPVLQDAQHGFIRIWV